MALLLGSSRTHPLSFVCSTPHLDAKLSRAALSSLLLTSFSGVTYSSFVFGCATAASSCSTPAPAGVMKVRRKGGEEQERFPNCGQGERRCCHMTCAREQNPPQKWLLLHPPHRARAMYKRPRPPSSLSNSSVSHLLPRMQWLRSVGRRGCDCCCCCYTRGYRA